MKIKYHKNFEKRFKKLSAPLQDKTIASVGRFAKNPFDERLKNHALKGKLSGKRAFSVAGNVRVIFEEFDGYVLVVMPDVGTHAQVYGS